MSKNWQELTIALAGIFQATHLVEKVAKTGQVPTDAFQCSVESVLDLNPESTLAVYGGNIENLRVGLEVMRDLLRPSSSMHRETLNYALGVLHLQKKLAGRGDMLSILANRLEQASQQAQHFSSTHENVIANLATLYSDTLSTFRYRIQVNGDYNYLQQQRIANQIRTLLLAAVRSAMLWRQLGGRRWHFVLNRKQIAIEVDKLLRTI